MTLQPSQINAEYVAYNIKALAKKSKTGKVNSISHSEGGLITQFALNYFPSARPFVENFVALAADFHGTDEGETALQIPFEYQISIFRKI